MSDADETSAELMERFLTGVDRLDQGDMNWIIGWLAGMYPEALIEAMEARLARTRSADRVKGHDL